MADGFKDRISSATRMVSNAAARRGALVALPVVLVGVAAVVAVGHMRRKDGGPDTLAPETKAAGLIAHPTSDGVDEPDRGRDAERVSDMPGKAWIDILLRTVRGLLTHNTGLVAAGITFYALLALFPAVVALVSLYGLIGGGLDMDLGFLRFVLPGETGEFVLGQIASVAEARTHELSIAFFSGLLIAIWGANGATSALFLAMNIVYEEGEGRSFLTRTLVSLLFTFCALVVAALAAFTAAAMALSSSPIAPEWATWAAAGRLVLQWAAGFAGLSLLYRFGPSRADARWRWINWGAAIASAAWTLSSAVFATAIAAAPQLGAIYGSVSAVMLLGVWIYIGAIIAIAGAQLNAEIEHQTAIDTTTGAARPMGERGAWMADTLGDAQR